MTLPPIVVAAGELLQHVSRTAYRSTPLYFGRDATNRYDSPDRGYGVLYLGFDLATALMESVFHQHHWHRGAKRSIALSEVNARMVRAVDVRVDLCLADLTAPGAMVQHFGLNLSQLTSRRYVHTQGVSKAAHAAIGAAGVPVFDGVLYPSRNNYPSSCIALFDRAKHKLDCIDDIDLADHADWPRFVRDFRVGIVSALSVARPSRRHSKSP